MTTTSSATSITSETTATRPAPMWRIGVLAAVAAAVATTAVAAVATGIGVPVEIDGAPIPLLGFAQLTLVFSA
ncbi:MAG: cell envelope biogenesis protein OmpA, partial [Streptosporangiales bacterium]|nr:cell envelope biogenesis protein OmpA [Streptosporangiales bacterium]